MDGVLELCGEVDGWVEIVGECECMPQMFSEDLHKLVSVPETQASG